MRPERAGYKRTEKPWWWSNFLQCATRSGWVEARIVNIPTQLRADITASIGSMAEWRPYSGAAMEIREELGLSYNALGGMGISATYHADTADGWELLFGSGRRRGEMGDFRTYISLKKCHAAMTITPSEAGYELWLDDQYWTHSWKCDSVKYCDCSGERGTCIYGAREDMPDSTWTYQEGR